jgi:hypothetical protein
MFLAHLLEDLVSIHHVNLSTFTLGNLSKISGLLAMKINGETT